MFFGIILTRILFVASMVFIIGYVFGNFSRNRTLTVITKVASILAIVLFISVNIFHARFGGWRHAGHYQEKGCYISPKDSTVIR